MDNVIQFPIFNQRAWREIEPGIREILIAKGADENAADWICNDLKPRIAAANIEGKLDLTIPTNCQSHVNEAIARCVEMMDDVSNRFLLELLKLEIELFNANFDNSAPKGAAG